MAPKVRIDVATRTERQHHVMLTDEDLQEMLEAAGIQIPANTTDVRIYFSVPGGGDWSNMNVDIDVHNPVHIKWTTVEESL